MLKRYKDFVKNRSQYQFGCVLVDYNFSNWQQFLEEILKIQDDDVYEVEGQNYGIEPRPHLTLLYGLHQEVSNEQVQSCFTGFNIDDFKVHINGIDIFENEQYDVIKLNVVKTQKLEEIHQRLTKLPNSDKYPQYNPHITCAYVKSGLGKKYIHGDYKHEIQNINKIVYTRPNKSEYIINL
jgi:hypothetical protein